MTALSIGSRLRLLRTVARINRRRRRSRMMRSPLIGWMFPQGACDEIILVPSDLRTPDPSFIDELKAGSIGLGGETVTIGSTSPFQGKLGGERWTTELHGFGWLNHLAVADEDGKTHARRLVHDWIDRAGRLERVAWRVDVMARRMISWITHSGLILVDDDDAQNERFLRSLGRQLHLLDILRHETPPGPNNLKALSALLLADLTIARREQKLAKTERLFLGELKAQILGDGGHISRNPAVALDLVLDLLPLRRCYVARDRALPESLGVTVENSLGFLRAMRLGDGTLGCFNGAGVMPLDALATAMSISNITTLSPLASSGYIRLEADPLVVLMDCGAPPLLEYSSDAQAGCLSFEMSDGPDLVIVNGGMPAAHVDGDRAAARATSNHSTLSIDGRSSGALTPYEPLGLMAEQSALVGPPSVGFSRSQTTASQTVEAWHDGYLRSHNLIHKRTITLASSGHEIAGIDSLSRRPSDVRSRSDVLFAIRFHLAASTVVRIIEGEGSTAEIALPRGAKWRLSAENASIGLEASEAAGRGAGLRPSRRIVLRASTADTANVSWKLTRAI